MLARWWCRAGGQLLLWAEFSPFPTWHRKYVIENIIRCSKINISKIHEGI
jgi:hypothetical protein